MNRFLSRAGRWPRAGLPGAVALAVVLVAPIPPVAARQAPVLHAAPATLAADTTPPTVAVPLARMRKGAVLAGTSIPLVVGWSPSDPGGSGVAASTLQKSVDDLTWSTISSTLAGGSAAVTVAAKGTIAFRARAVDRAGNVGSWAYGPTLSPRLVQQASTAITYRGRWTTATSTSYSGGSARYATTAGASATYAFTGRSVALVTTKAPARGRVRVVVDGTQVATVDLRATRTIYRVLAWQASWSAAARHTVSFVVEGTAGRPRVDLDALAVLVGPQPLPAAVHWELQPASQVLAGAGIHDVTSASGRYVAVGWRLSADPRTDLTAAWTSPDGVTWTRASNASTVGAMEAVAAGHGRVVAVGRAPATAGSDRDKATIWTSTDGRSWTRLAGLPVPSWSYLADVVATPAGFVAVGSWLDSQTRPSALAMLSPDGVHWERATLIEGARDRFARGVTVGGPGLIAYGGEGDTSSVRGVIWTSRDGRTWARSPDVPGFASDGWPAESRSIDLVFGARGRWFAVATPTSASYPTFSSPNGISWKQLGAADLATIRPGAAVRYADETVAVGHEPAAQYWDSSTPGSWRSVDGMSWQPIPVQDTGVADEWNYMVAITTGPAGPMAVGFPGGPSDPSPRGLVWLLRRYSAP